jgi:hypothetical protein
MGTWGPGNFDDDTARDYLAEVIGRFERTIDRILAGDFPEEAIGLHNILDAGEHCLLPTVEIIVALHEALGSDYLPAPEKVARWAEDYRHQVEPLMKEVDPVGYEKWYVKERRPVVAATFERLLQLSKRRNQGQERGGRTSH